jgi:hypothetical protein
MANTAKMILLIFWEENAEMPSKTRGLLLASMLFLSACNSNENQSDTDYSPNSARDTASFDSAVSRMCTRLGLAFSQTDVNFLLQELSSAIAGTGFSDAEAVDALRVQCPNMVAYANALP